MVGESPARTSCGEALASGGEVRHETLDRGVVALDHDRAGDQRLDHAEPREMGFGGEELEHRRDPGPHRPRPLLLLIERLGHPPAQLGHHRVVSRDEALVLALEVLVEGAPGDRRVAGDVGDRRPRVAILRNRLGETRDQALALVVADELAGQAVAPRRQAGQLGGILGRLDRRVGWISQENRRYRSRRGEPILANWPVF